MIAVKRVYAPEQPEDGTRFLVERLWPRGIRKESLHVAGWLKDVAPSSELRRWFNHDPARWDEFQKRYTAELQSNPNAWQPILEAARKGNVTLVYSSRDEEHNNAVALKKFLDKKLAAETAAR